MELHNFYVDTLSPNEAEPPSRLTDAALKVLKADIAKHGIQEPIMITSNLQILDGHRRWLCCKHLGIELIPAIVCAAADWFVRQNATTRRMTGAEYLHAYLHNGIMPLTDSGRYIRKLEELGGRTLLVEISARGMSPTVWGTARYLCRFCGIDDAREDLLRMALDYLIDGQRQALVKAAIRGGISPKALWHAVEQNRDPQMTWK